MLSRKLELCLPILALALACACDVPPKGGSDTGGTETGDDGDTSTGTETGDGDGDVTGDGDGEPTGDGDGEPTGDGDGEPTGDGDGDGDGDGEIVHEQPCFDPDRELPPPAELCPPGRQIVQVAGDCPPPMVGSGWTVESLFDGIPVPAALTRYCRYEWVDRGPADVNTLPPAVQGVSSPDCVVLPQSPLDASLGVSYAGTHDQAIQRLPSPGELGPGFNVRTAVVDTAPAATKLGDSRHGPTVAALVAAAAGGCVPGLDDPSCQRAVSTFVGLPQVRDGAPNYAKGGSYGYQTDLAEGIAAAVAAWTNKDDKQILNLSVGWEPSLGDLDGQGESPNAAILAVRDAIAFGHCQGMLTIAASGNQPLGSCVDQPTGPGSWERLPGWTDAQCLDLGLAPGDLKIDPTLPYRPFLYAATPVDWPLDNLGDFRPGSNARIAAAGFAGTATAGGASYGPMTGSSVATASLSGIAALVWSYFPTLAGDEVMALIYESGKQRGPDDDPVLADVYLGPSAPIQHVASACRAVGWACLNQPNPPANCQVVIDQCNEHYGPTLDFVVDEGGWWTAFTTGFAQLPPADVDLAQAPAWIDYECESCGQPTGAGFPADESIAAEAMPDPWVLPQPATPPCPMCMIDEDEVYLALDSAYANMTLVNVAVTLYDAIGGAEYQYYGALPLSPFRYYVVTDPDVEIVDRSGLPPLRARVTMTFAYATGSGTVRVTAGNDIPVR